MTTYWAVAVAALGTSALIGLAAFGLDWWRTRRTNREAREVTLRQACERLITGTKRATMRTDGDDRSLVA